MASAMTQRSYCEYRYSKEDPVKYWKQSEAIEEAKKNEKLIIFATEISKDGKRFYRVMPAEDMWNIFKHTATDSRHVHEVIRKGVPCKLYFDIEFKTQFNPDSVGDDMVKTFIQLVCWALKQKKNIPCSISDVLWLTSSTEEKYSAHLIFQLENHAFKDNAEAGNFFFYLRHIIKSQPGDSVSMRPSAEELKKLIIKNDNGNEEVFCDTAVYAKNKNFRIFLSTKFGKTTPLVLSKCNQYHCYDEDDWEKQLFMDSLITHFRRRDNLILLEFSDVYKPIPKGKSGKRCKTVVSKASGYLAADNFVRQLISKNGGIYRITEFKGNDMLLYEIDGYRYCKNIQREHRSNNIMFILDMKNRVYYQKCHDPDCKAVDFRSEKLPLPKSVVESYYSTLEDKILLETSLTEEDEIELSRLAAQLEKTELGSK